jgi:metal-responsive CopG/Arc/MetJ family transcriptional regulator
MTISINPTKSKTAISIDEKLLQETDLIAQELSVSRSQVVASALDEYVRRYRNQQLLTQINAAYSGELDEDEQETLQVIRSLGKKLGETDKWK